MRSSPARRFAEIGTDKPAVGPRAELGTAIVLGGSVAGMLAARVLADHAEAVLIIERDAMTGYLQPGLYRLGLYDVHMELLRDGEPLTEAVVRRVGYRQVREPEQL